MNARTTHPAIRRTPVDYDPFAGGSLLKVAPTSEPQRELWLASQLDEGAALAWNQSISLHLRGAIDAARLQHALQVVVDRHEALRAGFGPDGETFYVLEPQPVLLPLVDLGGLAPAAREAGLAERRRLGVETPFDLKAGRLFRAELVRLGDDEHVLLMHAHHLVCDGWSWWVVVREIAAAYAAGDAEPGLPEAGSYVDYAVAEAARQDSVGFGRDEQYWLSRFEGGAPVLGLPTDRPRPPRRSFASRRMDHMLDAELVASLRRLGAPRGVGLFAMLLGGFANVLSRIAGQDEVVIGIPAAGQLADGRAHVVGHCVNLLPLKFELQPGASVTTLLDRSQALLLDALDHRHYTFGTLLKKLRMARDPSRIPLASVMFNLDQPLDLEKSGFHGLGVEVASSPRSYENFELSINAAPVADGLRLEVQYNTDLFDAATVRRWLAAFEAFLRAACARPDAEAARLVTLEAEQGGAADAARGRVASADAPVPAGAPAPAVPQATRRDDGSVAAKIAARMGELLELPDFDPEEDFFAAGGHSLLAARLAGWLEQAFGAPFKLRTLFDAPTAAELAEIVLAQQPAESATRGTFEIPRRDDQSRGPLSLMQERLWIQEQILPDTINHTIPYALRLRGRVDVEALDRAFADLVRRHPSLRTIIESDDGQVGQRVLDDVPATLLPVEDLSGLPEEGREGAFVGRVQRLIAAPIRIHDNPLFRARLFRISDEEHVLFFQVHHAVWDGPSYGVLCDEMAALYAAHEAGGAAELPVLERSYIDFAAWHAEASDSDEVRAQLAHWCDRLSGGIEPLRLPEDSPRPAVGSGRGGSEYVALDASMATRLRSLGQSHRATLFMTLLAAYFLFLHRMTGQRDLVVALPVRSRLTSPLQQVIGFFANVLPMRLELDPDWTFAELLGHVRDGVLACFANQDVPVERLVQALGLPRDMSRSPLYQALFSMDDARGRARQWGGLRCEDVTLPNFSALTDLALWVDEDDDHLRIEVNYNADVISAASAQRMARRFEDLLARLTDGAGDAIGAIDFRSDEDREALNAWNATTTPLPPVANLAELVAPQFARAPDRIALRFGERGMTYRELDDRSNQLANALAARGVGTGDLVGICLDREPDLIAALLAVLRLGAAYVPLDPAYPADRLRFMVKDAALALVVSQAELAGRLELPAARLLLLDRDAGEITAAAPHGRASAGADRSTPAYVIYTSGSTGTPKGVAVPHGAAINFLESMRHAPGLAADDVLLAVTTTSFDISVLEIFLPLCVGATLVLSTREQAADGSRLAALLEAERATVLQATPTTWHLLLDAGWRPQPGFRALCGGEPMSQDLAGTLLDRGIDLWNMYGPTETTVWSTCTRIQRTAGGGAPDIHVGRPIANTSVWILDERGQVCPVGVPGEICIGGAGVALGYLGREELTAQKFVPDRIAPVDHDTGLPPRLYRTGDRGRWRPDGVIEHQGRMDFQVKVRGHRIELGEIESALDADPGILRSVVIVREDTPGDVRLVAYVIAADREGFDARAQLVRLRKVLPAYMVPQHVVVLGTLPLLPNGKVDRSRLPPPALREPAPSQEPATSAGADTAPDAVPREVAYLAGVCSELIGEAVGPADNFFDAGGHSLLAVRLINRVEKDTGIRLNILALATSTIGQMAGQLAGSDRFAPRRATGMHRGGAMGRVKQWLSFALGG